MAARTVPIRVGDVELLAEVTVLPGTEQTSKTTKVAEEATEAFTRAQRAIVEVARSTVEAIREAADRAARPDTVEVTFGLKFSAQGNVILAGVAGEATLGVKLVYQAKDEP